METLESPRSITDTCIVKEKYGSDYEQDEDEEDSEEAESEDEDGEELTPAVDAAILRTLARIKRKDPSIYQQGKDVFEGLFCARFTARVCLQSAVEEVQKTEEVKRITRGSKDKVRT